MTFTRLLITSAIGGLLACTAAHAAPAAAASAPVSARQGRVTLVAESTMKKTQTPPARIAAADSVAALLAQVGNISEGW